MPKISLFSLYELTFFRCSTPLLSPYSVTDLQSYLCVIDILPLSQHFSIAVHHLGGETSSHIDILTHYTITSIGLSHPKGKQYWNVPCWFLISHCPSGQYIKKLPRYSPMTPFLLGHVIGHSAVSASVCANTAVFENQCVTLLWCVLTFITEQTISPLLTTNDCLFIAS